MKFATDNDGRQILYLHQSDINDLRKCPEQARLKARGDYFDPDSDVAQIGTRTHAFIEAVLYHAMANGEYPDADMLEDVLAEQVQLLRDEWDTLWHHPDMVSGVDHAITDLQGCSVRWFNQILPQIPFTPDQWRIETEFDAGVLRTPDYDVRLRGTIDLFDGATIWDWKTGRYDPRSKWQKDRYDIQSTIYSWARGGRPFNLAFMPRGGDETFVVPLERTDAHYATMLWEVEGWGRTIMTLGLDQEWPIGPTDWWCSTRWCSEFALGRCMGSHHGSHWPDEPNNVVELKRKVDAGLIPAPAEHHPLRREQDG